MPFKKTVWDTIQEVGGTFIQYYNIGITSTVCGKWPCHDWVCPHIPLWPPVPCTVPSDFLYGSVLTGGSLQHSTDHTHTHTKSWTVSSSSPSFPLLLVYLMTFSCSVTVPTESRENKNMHMDSQSDLTLSCWRILSLTPCLTLTSSLHPCLTLSSSLSSQGSPHLTPPCLCVSLELRTQVGAQRHSAASAAHHTAARQRLVTYHGTSKIATLTGIYRELPPAKPPHR